MKTARSVFMTASIICSLPFCAAAAGTSDAVLPGDVIVEPPTLQSLGFEWSLSGDANRNAAVAIRYRRKGTDVWREGLPLLRIGGEETKYQAVDFTAAPMFAGSLFDLEPDSTYEITLKISDPDGVKGKAERHVEARTRAVPKPVGDGHTYHVYPQGYQGQKQQPAFNGLLAAFNTGSSSTDWNNSFPPRVQPGDVIVVHAGLYKDTRYKYGSGIGTLFDGTYYLTASGTPERPIVIRAAGDGPAIFDGDGNAVLFDVTAANNIYFEGLTFRNTEVAILAGRKRIVGSSGLTVKRSRFEDVGMGITTEWSGSKNFTIADNVFVGRQIPDHLMGWIGRTWQDFPDFPVAMRSEYAVKVYGAGHVIEHNDVSHFHDGIDNATYGNPDVDAKGRLVRDRAPVSVDIIGNDIRDVDDNCIEADGGMANIRVLRNRCFNQAHRALSAQPLFGGPVYFIGNLVYDAPEGGSLKFQASPAGILVYQNTFIGEVHDMGPASNLHYRNNLVLGQGAYPEIFTTDTFTNYSSSDYNGFRPNPGAKQSFVWNSPPKNVLADFTRDREKRSFATLQEYAQATGQDTHSILIDYGDFVRVSAPDPKDSRRFYKPDEFDFSLNAKSRAVDAGMVLPNVNDGFAGKAPDLGAYELGRPVPSYGPRMEAPPAAASTSVPAAVESGPIDLAAALSEFQLAESNRPVKELITSWVAPRKLVVVIDRPERTAWLQQGMPPGVTVVGVRRDADAQAELADADAIIEVNCAIAVGDAPKPKLRWIHGNSGGGDTCLQIPGVARGDILLTNSQKVKNTVLAEMGMGYVFALARSIDVGLANQRERDLNKRGRPGKRLEGATMLIVGLGGAGTEIARMAYAMGMKVIATDPVNRNPPDFVSHVGLPDELPSLVGQADVVMIAAPLTPATRGLFNAAMFARMKHDAIFVNWTRADIVVTDDLAAALKSGTIGSAALNWASQTPLAKDNPLWDAPNLILAPWAGTPVTASRDTSTRAARDNEMRWFVVRENMRRFATGGKMYSVFDLARGY